MEYRYDINQFDWDKNSNQLSAHRSSLWNYDFAYATIPFINGRTQFFIDNPTTGGFRRFRFVYETDSSWYFKSEDGIEVKILID